MSLNNLLAIIFRLEPVVLKSNQSIEQLLDYYMGKNTQEHQTFIIPIILKMKKMK